MAVKISSKLLGALLCLLVASGCHSKDAAFKSAMDAYLQAASQMIAALDDTALSPTKTAEYQEAVESAFDNIPLYPPGNEELEKAFRTADKLRIWLRGRSEFVRGTWYKGRHVAVTFLDDAKRRVAEMRQRLDS